MKQEEVIEKLEALLKDRLKEAKREKQALTDENVSVGVVWTRFLMRCKLKETLSKSQSQVQALKRGIELGPLPDHQCMLQMIEPAVIDFVQAKLIGEAG